MSSLAVFVAVRVRVRWRLVGVAAVLLAGSASAAAAADTPSRYAAAVEATPGLQHYLRFGDSGTVVDPFYGRRATDLGPATYSAGLTAAQAAAHYAAGVGAP
jgi:hypothetical protein